MPLRFRLAALFRRLARSRLSALVLAAVALAPLAARADAPIPLPLEAPPTSVMYFAPDLGYHAQNMPRFQSGALGPGSAIPFYTNSPNAQGISGGVTVGLMMPPSWPQFGQHARLEFGLAYFDLTDVDSIKYPGGTPGNVQWVLIGGRSTSLTTGGVFSSTLKTEYRGFELSAKAATDVQAAPNLTLTPAFGVFGGNSESIFNYTDRELCAAVCFNEFSRENVSANRIGGAVSLGARFPVGANLSLIGGVSGALFGAWAQLSGNDCFANVSVVPCDATLNFGSTVNNNKSAFGARIGAQAGLRYNAGWTRLDFTGGLNWDSALPGVSNPVLPGRAATIAFSSELGYSVRLGASIPFGGDWP